MKKWIGMVLCVIFIVTLASCGNENETSGRTGKQAAGVNDVLEAGMEETDRESAKDSGQASDAKERQRGVKEDEPDELPQSADGIEIDLTALSGTMVYSEVYNMMAAPEKYIGKTVKMEGLFAIYHDEDTNKDYFSCIIQDATACCSQGIEFALTDDYTYPDDYPKEGGKICVAGVFDTYKEGDYTYCMLKNAKIV